LPMTILKNNPLKVVVMGTTDFAVPALEALIASDFEVVCVVCQPDRPNGRGKKVRFLPMKQKAVDAGIPVFQPEKVKTPDAVAYLQTLDADFFVVAAYGQILSQEVLDIPRLGCINIHGSILPEYRGAAPIHHAIIEGRDESGVTVMKMDAGMDTGDMLAIGRLPITDTTTVGEYHDALAALGAKLLIPTLEVLVTGTITPMPQDNDKATYADKIDKHTGEIDWSQPGRAILRRINGTDPWPGAFTLFEGQTMKCFGPELLPGGGDAAPGTVLSADKKHGLTVKTGDGILRLKAIQMPGKRRMASEDYLRGNAISVGTVLGIK